MPTSSFHSAPIAYAGGRLDRADARRNDADWLDDQRCAESTRVMILDDDRVLVEVGGDRPLVAWATAGLLTGDARLAANAVLLGLNDEGAAFFAVDIGAEAETLVSRDRRLVDARSLAMQIGGDADGQLPLVAQAKSVLNWHRRHRYCANCGATTRIARAGYMRQCERAGCGAQHFPRVDPVVIMLAIDRDRCLLGRQPRFPRGFYSALAGYMEPGETIEEAVRREVSEEAGVRVGAVRYIASQPWPFPSSLMIGCLAEATHTAIMIDQDELEDARWVSLQTVRAAQAEALPDLILPPPIAIARQLINYWVETCV